MAVVNIKYKTSFPSREKLFSVTVHNEEPLQTEVKDFRKNKSEMSALFDEASSKYDENSFIKTEEGFKKIISNSKIEGKWRSNPNSSEDEIFLEGETGMISVWKNGEWKKSYTLNEVIQNKKCIYFIDYENFHNFDLAEYANKESEFVILFGHMQKPLSFGNLFKLSGLKTHYFKCNYGGANVADAFLMYIVGTFEHKYDLDTTFIFVSKDKMFSKMIFDISKNIKPIRNYYRVF